MNQIFQLYANLTKYLSVIPFSSCNKAEQVSNAGCQIPDFVPKLVPHSKSLMQKEHLSSFQLCSGISTFLTSNRHLVFY